MNHNLASLEQEGDEATEKAEQEELEKKRQYRKEKAENKMPRLSNLKWDENKVAQDLKLTDELTSTLRELVPEGSVMTERYQVSSHEYLWYLVDNELVMN